MVEKHHFQDSAHGSLPNTKDDFFHLALLICLLVVF